MNSSLFFGFGSGFGLMELLFPVAFLAIFIAVIVGIVKALAQWSRNNHSPVLTVDAEVVTKRTSTDTHVHDGHHHHSTAHYATFEVDSGDRMEFSVTGREYGRLAEGDVGRLTFQGTRYLAFERAGL